MSQAWTTEQRARTLIQRRDALLARFPAEIRAARDLRPDLRELILDEAITYAALEHPGDITSQEDLEGLVWGACARRVRQAHRRVYETVRAGYRPADPDTLNDVGTDPDIDPAAVTVRRDELRTVLEFARSLDDRERDVLACKYGGGTELGYKEIARHLGIPNHRVRRAERSIAQKLDHFAAIVSAGRLCGFRAPAVASLAAGNAASHDAQAARAHLDHCSACATAYKRHVHYLQSAAFKGKVAATLPFPAAASDRMRPGAGMRDALVDWITRPFANDAASNAAQLASSGVGRGAGTALAIKLAALCIGGAGTLSVCVATGVLPDPLRDGGKTEAPDRPRATADKRRAIAPDRIPTKAEAGLIATPTPTPTPKARRRTRRASQPQRGTSQTTQGGTSATSHEQPPASPPPAGAGSTTGGGSEFNFESTPNTKPRPAPVPRAPGAREFNP